MSTDFCSKHAIKQKLKELQEFSGEVDIHKIVADAGDIWIHGTPSTFESLISDFLQPFRSQPSPINNAFVQYFESTWGTPEAHFSVWKYGQCVAFDPMEAKWTNNIAEASHGAL